TFRNAAPIRHVREVVANARPFQMLWVVQPGAARKRSDEFLGKRLRQYVSENGAAVRDEEKAAVEVEHIQGLRELRVVSDVEIHGNPIRICGHIELRAEDGVVCGLASYPGIEGVSMEQRVRGVAERSLPRCPRRGSVLPPDMLEDP